MKFDYVIGNPPYQETQEGTSDNPIYNCFMDAAYEIAEKVELITPARFLFDAGKTPKVWNEKMLEDEHLKVEYYEQDSSKVFSNTDIKGGVAVTYRDKSKIFGAIDTFTQYPVLNNILVEKPRAKYKAEHEAELKQFYAARRKLTGEFPDGKVDMKKLTEEYDELEQAHETTYGEFKTVRDDLHRLWKVKSCVDTAARFNERTEEQMLQNRPQTLHKKEDISR